MGDPVTYTPETLIRMLKFSTIRKLAQVLDPQNELAMDWRDFAQRLPKRPGSKELRYDIRKIEFLAHKQKSCSKSPTESIISDLCTLNTRVKDIVKILEDMDHIEAIQILLPDYTIPIKHPEVPEVEFQVKAPEFDANNTFREFSSAEVAALTDNFNATLLLDGGRQIGRGGFGIVFLGYFRDGTKCAVKKLIKEGLHSEVNILKQLQIEANTLMNFQHVNLVKIYGHCLESMSLILEYISGDNLSQRLACQDNKQPLSWKSRVAIATGTARGINFLHERKYVHRDIKSANILLDGNLVPKLVDFGLVRRIPDGKTMEVTSIVIASLVYLAPESRCGRFSYRSDVYSFGVVLLEIITGLRVFDKHREGNDIISFIEDVVEVEDTILDYVDKKSCPYADRQVKVMHRIARDCLKQKVYRPTMNEVYNVLLSIGQ